MLHILSLMLHGYGSDAEAFRRDTKMDEAAVKRGYGVVYVTGSHYEQDKISATGWNTGIGESSSDDVVPMKLNGSHRFSQAPAIEDVIEYFVSINNLNKNTKENISDKVEIEKNYSDESKEQVWQVVIKDGRHSWPDQNLYGFSTNELILDFFESIN